ncbi:MAG TPA: methyltransferase [Casimicrobiaceae bacterium]|nr:methyltransferase [Casimicrobiaceae bacterium]
MKPDIPPAVSPAVQDQYERFPYPLRDPAEENERIIRTWLDDLPMINQYCFGGRRRFDRGFRALVAGGGTGDGTIYLAEQLRDTEAEIVHVDISAASNRIARERAAVRGLRNIRWIESSLLALSPRDLGVFDYINCCGVLHHLEDPEAGMAALLPLRAEGGAFGIMVYAQFGRTGIYQMQALLRLINAGIDDPERKLDNVRQLLPRLPRSNWFARAQDLYREHVIGGDAGMYDMLLHAQDRAYTVGEIYAWFEDRCKLSIQFTDVNRGPAAYTPRLLAPPDDNRLWNEVDLLPLRRQQEIAELFSGSVKMHVFYATAGTGTKAPYGDLDYVPFFFHEPVTGQELCDLITRHHDRPFVLSHSFSGITTRVDPGRYAKYVLRHIDGTRTFREIFDRVRAEPQCANRPPGDDELFADFAGVFAVLHAIDRLLLRHRTA